MKELLAELASDKPSLLLLFHHHALRELNGSLFISASEMCSNLKWRTYSDRGRRPTVFNYVMVNVVIYIEYFVQNVYRACAYSEINLMKNMIYSVECAPLWFLFVFSNYLSEVVIKGFSTRGWGSAAALKPPTDEANHIRAGVLVPIPVFHVDALKPIKPSRSHFNVVGDCRSLSGDISEPHHVIKPW